jgi:hypothetical protein
MPLCGGKADGAPDEQGRCCEYELPLLEHLQFLLDKARYNVRAAGNRARLRVRASEALRITQNILRDWRDSITARGIGLSSKCDILWP